MGKGTYDFKNKINTMEKGEQNGVNFFINGESYNVNPESEKFDLDTPLVDFIRDTAGLKGTKLMCREGGCGACVVTVKNKDPVTGREITKAVNSCLTPVLSCDGWDISTVERLGNKKIGYHKIQERLAHFNGTQCGYCTPGMVMSMYSLLNSKENITVQDVNDNFDGNICRCTGYRPILDAFKSFAIDAPEDLRQKCKDIEDSSGCPCVKPGINGGGCCKQQVSQSSKSTSVVNFKLPSGHEWVQPKDLATTLTNLSKFSAEGKKYRVVAGNTGTGVFKYDGPYDAFLDINNISDLKKSKMDESEVVMGAGISLTSAIKFLRDASKLIGFEYTSGISKHWERVANVPVRNNATIAGNLMMKHAHHDFPSDIFLILESVGAEINIADAKGCHLKSLVGLSTCKRHTLLEFLNMDMNGKLIVSIHLPPWKGGYYFRSFKITRRYQNAHAYVNAGFLLKVDPAQNFKVLEQPRILLGGIHSKFTHASATEAFLTGKCLGDQQTLKEVLEVMDKEIQPDYNALDGTADYRRTLSKGLLYKTILSIIENKVSTSLKSGSLDIKRVISTGKQIHEQQEDDTVLYQNVPKLEAAVQSSGEAEYVNDIPPRPNELFGACVLSTVANADLKSIDASEALKIPGVVAFITEKDVPGTNNYMTYNFFPIPADEKIYAKDRVNHAGQLIGVIVAKSNAIAAAAVKKVHVNYSNQQKPLLDIAESLKKVEAEGTLDAHFINISKSKTPPPDEPSKNIIKGEFKIGSQYHFHMETQCCICVPKEDGMDVFSATQWTDHGQIVISDALGVPSNNINMEVRRLGGSFGGKITRATHLSTACAVAANAVGKPVRIVLDLETNMRMMGKRNPYLSRYEVGFDDNGRIEKLNIEIFCDPGYAPTESDTFIAGNHVQNVYAANGWEIKPGFLLTDTPSNTSCRAPGTTQGVASIEYIMEHIAHAVGKDPLDVRVANFMKKGDQIITSGHELESENIALRMIEEIKISGDYENRKKSVETFNKVNRWKKRGLSLVPVRYELDYFNIVKFPVSVVVYHRDGYVAVSHGGIEMGQGLNTKVAQTVAYMLKIPIDKIKIRPTNSFVGANSMVSGGSFASEICCGAAKEACQILLDRMAPIKEKLEDKSWGNVINECYNANLDLYASYMYGPNDNVKEYYIWAVNLTEVEVDMLTGEYKVSRVDLIEDAGKSLSPGVDIGQVEGAHIMGQGLWTTEKIVYDEQTGQLLTNSTWEYKPPETKDIPEDFRITLLSNAPNPYGVLRSKATGEPPLVASVAVLFAIKHAIDSARKDAGNTDWYQMDGPVTPEDIVRYALTSSTQFTY